MIKKEELLMLIQKADNFFKEHGLEKEIWSSMFCTTSRRSRLENKKDKEKNELISPDLSLFRNAIKGNLKITWKISEKDFAYILIDSISKAPKTKKDFYNFCKQNLSCFPEEIDIEKMGEEEIYKLIYCLALDIRLESYNNEHINYIKSGTSDNSVRLLTNIKPCRSVFKGRDKQISQIHRYFQAKNHFLFLQGIGGIGKSECAKQFAKKYKNKYDVIIFAECSDSIISSINDNSIFGLTEPFCPKNNTENEEQFYKRKLNQLKTIKGKILIILDNVDYFSEEIDNFLALPFDIIITTRYNYFSEYPNQTIHITEIKDMTILKDIFAEYYGKDVSNDPFTEKIINMFECHTMAIELVAKQAKASNLTPKEIFDIMQNNTEYEFSETFRVMNYDGKQLNIFNYMQKLFNIASLTEQEQYVMMCLSLLPITGMEKCKFKNYCQLKDYSVINKLTELSWIRDIEGQLTIHTLIKETVKIFCKPDFSKCQNFLNAITEEHSPYKIYYENHICKEKVKK